MKKGTKGEAVLSARQIQATRLNRLEYRRLQNHIDLLRDDLQNHLARLHRQEESLRYHYTNVVRVVKPNRAYQLWKQVHAHEIAQDEEEDLIGLIVYISYFIFFVYVLRAIHSSLESKVAPCSLLENNKLDVIDMI